ncbi:PFA4 (YOL003C) [Zygosaccharomyces parabailii]|nr:PFA4 (YOL003C) [Zygosaccharomyces parabailii]CDH08379.1 probable PFA4-Palmitoyltransferase [Zygosaccharomyces bailii ISA1307]
MPVKLKWPFLGVAIPCFLISFIGYNAHYFVLTNFLSQKEQIWFQVSLTMIWLSYYLAIYAPPGHPPRNFQPPPKTWKNYCKKCQNYKPERAHHCKTCNSCVLAMDHHCPWTLNCVGYHNFPHFMRFLFWVIVTTGYLLIRLVLRAYFILSNYTTPMYLWKKSEVIFLAVLIPMDGFILLTIGILFIRCLSNQIFCGRTQIETWEYERLEGLFYRKRLISLLIQNFWDLHPECRTQDVENEATRLLTQRGIKFENIVNFPYDIDPLRNATQFLGAAYSWLWPFGKPAGSGLFFPKNDISDFEESELQDMLLSLPWPPDGGRDKVACINGSNRIETVVKNGEQLIRKRAIDTGDTISRKKWQNTWGENLEDFGVDIDAE